MATLKDIARATGFSTITVSRVINEPEKVRPETREIIQAEIERVNFRPNVLARALVQRRTNIIFVYIPSGLKPNDLFFMNVVSGIAEYLGEQGYSLLIKRTWYNNEDCDGCIFMGLSPEQEIEVAKLAKIKPVCVFGYAKDVMSIDIDNYAGLYKITRRVLERDFSNIVYVGINQDQRFVYDREKGFIDAVKEFKPDAKTKILKVANNDDDAYHETNELLIATREPRAFICASDDIAIGVMRALKHHGLKVPKDVVVTGFDGLGTDEVAYPHLTTVRQPIYEAGRELASHIIELIKRKNEGPYEYILIQPRLIVRDTF